MNLGNQVDGYNKVYNNFKKNSKIKLGTQSIPFSHSVLQDKRNGKVASSRSCIHGCVLVTILRRQRWFHKLLESWVRKMVSLCFSGLFNLQRFRKILI